MKSRQRPQDPVFNFAEAWSLRWPERRLLLLCALCITLGFALILGSSLAAGHPFAPFTLLPLLLYLGCLLVMHLTLVAVRFQGDQILMGALAFLVGFGLLAQSRLGSFDPANLNDPHLYLLPAGILSMLGLCIALMQGRYERLANGSWIWAGLSLLLLAALLLLGHRYRGGIYGAGLITPSELLKVTVVLFLASFIHRHAKPLANWGKGLPRPPVRALLPLVAFWLALAALLLIQRDLGMFVILNVTLLVMLSVGTGRAGYLLLGGVLASGAGYLLLALFAHGQRRIQAWWHPFEDPTGTSWQILQGLSGMYSGGLWGEGFGQGNPEYTPIAQSDFIYSVIGEELGFVGCVLLVIVFLVLFSRGLGIADQTRSGFGRLLSVGLTSVLAIQTFLNLGGVTKLIPLTGITLPFISHGGSSLVTGLISLGLMLAISEGAPATRHKDTAGTGAARKAPAKRGNASNRATKKRAERKKGGTQTKGSARSATGAASPRSGDARGRSRDAGAHSGTANQGRTRKPSTSR